jgi:hypothetical protein
MSFLDIEEDSLLVMQRDRLCKIEKVLKISPSVKIVTGSDLIKNKKYTETFYLCSKFPQYIYLTTQYGVLSYVPLILIDSNGQKRNDVKIVDDNLGKKCKNLFENDRNVLVTLLEITIHDNTEHRVINVTEELSTILPYLKFPFAIHFQCFKKN